MTTWSLPLAREGLPFIGAGLAAGVVALFLDWMWVAAAAGIVSVFFVNFFRDPERRPPSNPQAVVAPADGRVLRADVVEDGRFLQGPARMVSIFMSPLDVHVNRSPSAGRVTDVRYHPGRYFRAFAEKASLDNEQNAIVLEDERGRTMAFVQIAGFLARRIVCYLKPGVITERGARCGMIMFGSRVDVFLPADVALRVAVGSRTRAGETVIAEWTT
jgi:phosphatidylserine decarboxylase